MIFSLRLKLQTTTKVRLLNAITTQLGLISKEHAGDGAEKMSVQRSDNTWKN